ncbi:SpoIIE family protein phosphatase [Streptomyces sp. NPDC047706]|uniref:SpoIIE family protein phosphatase n=1 Tax=Streptomyces sp. NPDC047706 TaxID=3365486 RepID=UPI00371ED29F
MVTTVALAVGDVVGHGLNAAASMGRLRTVVHTHAAMELPRPTAGPPRRHGPTAGRRGLRRPRADSRGVGATCPLRRLRPRHPPVDHGIGRASRARADRCPRTVRHRAGERHRTGPGGRLGPGAGLPAHAVSLQLFRPDAEFDRTRNKNSVYCGPRCGSRASMRAYRQRKTALAAQHGPASK